MLTNAMNEYIYFVISFLLCSIDLFFCHLLNLMLGNEFEGLTPVRFFSQFELEKLGLGTSAL
jgi:hypothetical protein